MKKDKLYIEAFLSEDPVKREMPHTSYGYLYQLEQIILKTLPHLERLLPYLEEIRRALEAKDGTKVLALTDDLEEMMDLDLKSKSQ